MSKKKQSYTTGFNQLAHAKHGTLLYNENDKFIGKSIKTYGEFSELENALFEQFVKEGDVVVEVGSNIGAHTIALSKMVGSKGVVFAYEPQRIVFQTLCANLALNSITNVIANQVALSNEQGEVLIPDIDYTKEANYGGVNVEQFKEGFPIPKLTLDDSLKLKQLKFLKIDVEGMELQVLEGATQTIQKHRPLLYIENDRQDKSQALIEKIWELEYEIYWHLPALFNADNFAKHKENLFGNIVSVNMLAIPKELKINIEHFVKVEESDFHPMKK
jgi:FkbM family methyltransferase